MKLLLETVTYIAIKENHLDNCNSLSNSNYFMSAKKCRHKSCIIDFVLAKMEFASAILKKLYFPNIQLKGVVNRLPPFKNLSDHTNKFLMG